MKIVKYCACGVKLDRSVSDEETARKTVEMFWTEHAGSPHQPLTRKAYDALIRKIIKKKWDQKQYPITQMSEIETFESKQIDNALDWLEKNTEGV